MILNKEAVLRWLYFLMIATSIALVFSFPAKALDPRIAERLPMGYTEESDVKVFEGAFDKDAYNGGLPPESDREDEAPPEEETENDPLANVPEEYLPDVLDSGQVLDSGIDPQQKMYDDISGIRQGMDIIVYFVIPFVAGVVLLYKFGVWFYGTFIESAWNK